MLKIRRPLGRLIFNMGIAIPGKTVFLIETAPRSLQDMYGTELKNMGSSHIEAVTKWLPFSRHFQTHFVEWNYYILVKISLKYAPQGPIDIIPSLVQIMAWRRASDKPLSKPMKFSLMTHIYICVTRPQWVNTLRPTQNGCHSTHSSFKSIFFKENVRISIKFSLKLVPKGLINNIPALDQIMAWHRPGNKPLSEPVID